MISPPTWFSRGAHLGVERNWNGNHRHEYRSREFVFIPSRHCAHAPCASPAIQKHCISLFKYRASPRKSVVTPCTYAYFSLYHYGLRGICNMRTVCAWLKYGRFWPRRSLYLWIFFPVNVRTWLWQFCHTYVTIWIGQVDSSDDIILQWTCQCSQCFTTTWSKCTLTGQGEVVAVE